VRALTGVDTDRLKEEKARGISIDLGFAYLPSPDGSVLGFVDVPGHEKFVHNMLAGATGIDIVLLVVAVDDGIMPQTREHLAIVDLLGIERAIVVLTKADLAGPIQRAQVTDEIKQLLDGTALASANILPASTITGEGIGELRERLFEVARTIQARTARGRFRLAVDRSFTLAGAGTVITGRKDLSISSVVRALRHWLGGRRVNVKSRSPASSKLSPTARCLSRHLRMKALRRASISSGVAA
jgi:selenocysteine-specific elongation factor